MIGKPYDMTVTKEELGQADIWWRSLSINQMRAFEAQYFPNMSWDMLRDRAHHQIWEMEGKPAPQATIPV